MKHWLIMVLIALLTATAMTACIDDVAYGFVDDFKQTYLSAIERIIEG